MSNVYVEKQKLDILANAISAKSGEPLTLTLDEMVSVVDGIETGGGSGAGYVWQDANGYVHLSDEESSSITVEALSVTQNGIYTAPAGTAYSPVTVNVSGGTSKVVRDTFTTSSITGAAQTITIPYSGNGYPISCYVYPTDGVNGSINNVIQQYVIRMVYINKAILTALPTYRTTGTENQALVQVRYKNTSTTGTSYASGVATDANTFSSESATDTSRSLVVRFTSNTALSVFIASSSYGLLPSMEYTYIIEYSE